jgi:hypothetical protein
MVRPPDACASAAAIARRGLAGRAKIKDVLPSYDEGRRTQRWQEVPLPAELAGWVKVHRVMAGSLEGRSWTRDIFPAPQGWR